MTLDNAYISLFNEHRNLVPIFSIEGQRQETDARRGSGVYDQLIIAMERMQENHLMFGASITVTTSNLQEIVSHEFLDKLEKRGCKAVIFVEYVPIAEDNRELAPGDWERDFLRSKIDELRKHYSEMMFISFPGDEKTSGGCLAAGRGFFHINSHGGAEPCPFSPYSDINVRETSLREALHSKLFSALQDNGLLMEEHTGGCVLFERREQVEQLAAN